MLTTIYVLLSFCVALLMSSLFALGPLSTILVWLVVGILMFLFIKVYRKYN